MSTFVGTTLNVVVLVLAFQTVSAQQPTSVPTDTLYQKAMDGETGKSQGQFRGIHQLAYDSQGRLFVADSKNSRIQILDRAMKPVAVWTAFGRPSMIFITPADRRLTLDTESGLKLSWLDYSGDDPDGIRNPSFSVGVRIGSARTGVVDVHVSPNPQVASDMLAVDASGNLYARGAKWIRNKK